MRLLLALLIVLTPAVAAQDSDSRIKELEERIERLEHESAGEKEHGEDDARDEHDEHDEEGHIRARLLDLSLNIMTAAGTSTSTNSELRDLQLGNHDPRRRGFTLQQAELAFAGAIEPFFAGEAYIVASDEIVELEEAFLRSLFLQPWFEMKAGYFFTEFGRINSQHPHRWRWLDQPVAVGRILGGEGMRGVGGRVAGGFELPWHSRWLFAVQNADDPSMSSFLGEGHVHDGETVEETVGGWPRNERDTRALGDLLYSFRWENEIGIGDEVGIEIGASFAYGPNATGETGRTWLAGGDLMLEWESGEAFVRVEGEVLYRYFQANGAELGGGEVLDAAVLGDWGAYVEITGSPIHECYFGLRLDHASGFRSGEEVRKEDPLRDNRWRISPVASYRPIEEVQITLQYNFDHTQHLGGDTSHSVWIGVRVLFGIHKHIH